MFHHLIIGFFEPKAASLGELEVTRRLTKDDLRVIEAEWKTRRGKSVHLDKYFEDARGILAVPWLERPKDDKFAKILAKIAHEVLGAGAGDVAHGEILILPKDDSKA